MKYLQEGISIDRGDIQKKGIDVILNGLREKENYEESVKKVASYFLKTNCTRSKKIGMEFLYINGRYKDLQQLIIKNENSTSASNREWARVYQIMSNARKGQTPSIQLMNEIQFFETKDPIVEILLEFSKVIVYSQARNYTFFGSSIDKIDNLMPKCSNSFLRNCFKRRISLLMFCYYWSRNELIIARKIAFELLSESIDARTKVRLHSGLGLTYLFDTYEQGIYHLNKALDIAKKHNIKHLLYRVENHIIPFYSACFGKVDHIKTEAISEQAHIEIVKGNKQKAIDLLNQIENKSPFQYYYLGLAKEDHKILERSYNMFLIERNDYFYSRLPLYAMRKIQ